MKKPMTTQRAEELMQKYAATMRDEKENDLAKLRAMQKVSTTEQKAPKKKMSAGAKYAVIAACSCVLVLAIIFPVVFTGLFAAGSVADTSEDNYYPNEQFSDSYDAHNNKSSSSSPSPSQSQKGFVADTENFRLIAPNSNTVTYELLPAEERPSSADSANNNVGLQADILYSIVEWIVFTDKKGLTARVYIARTQEKKTRYEKTYDSFVSFGAYRLQYKITSGQEGVFSAQSKIESDDETVYIEYSQTGGNLETFCSWVNAAVSAK